MRSQISLLAAGWVLTALLLGCYRLHGPAALPAAGPVTADTHLTLLQTTDLHDHASGDGPMAAGAPGPTGSYARIAAYVNDVRQNATADRPVVLVDAGDWTMGTLYDFTLTQQPAATYFMDTLRYDCATLGNHEFDYSTKGLAQILAASQTAFGFHTPIVASNLALNNDTYLTPYLGTAITKTYTEVLPTGLKVGFIGLMGKAAAQDAPSSAPVTFADYSLDYPSIQALVDGLRNPQGCQVVIALSHAGTNAATGGYTGEDVALAQNVTGIDVIASGHTHNAFGADGAASHPVTRGPWTTQIISPGAYGAHVSRLDLTYHPAAANTTVDSASNLPMTDATLQALPGGIGLDPAAAVAVAQSDTALNTNLSLLLRDLFTDYSASDPNLGLYHPVGSAAQDLVANGANAVLNPNGLGNLCADGVRSSANDVVAASLKAAGWNGDPASSTLATAIKTLTAQGYDPNPFTAAIVPNGIIRDSLTGGAPISFANAYDVLPLGISPDTTQTVPMGYPLISAYLAYPDLQKLCALQLLSQTNLTPTDDYLNLSGFSCVLNPAAAYTYFKYATAASLYHLAAAKAVAGGPQATRALADLASLATDPTGATFLADQGGNPFVTAMAALNDPASPTPAQLAVNLPALAAVAACAQADAANGSSTLEALLFAKAFAAIGALSGFPSTDPACEGVPAALPLNQRFRVVGDLYTIFMMTTVQNQLGVTLTAYAGPTGSAAVAQANLAQTLANRISVNGPKPPVQELKPWMALILYLTKAPALGGWFTAGAIGPDYLSTATYTDFPTNGAAVSVRNASYPLASLTQLMATLSALASAS